MHIGNRLKRLRFLKGISQLHICKGIVSPSHYSNIESGRYDASNDILNTIAERLDVPTNYLLCLSKSDDELSVLLEQFEQLLFTDIQKAKAFYEEQKDNFDYISSMELELKFLLLYCFYLLKTYNIPDAKRKYKEILFYINNKNVMIFPDKAKFYYYYVSGLLHFYENKYLESYDFYNNTLLYSPSQVEEAKIKFNLSLVCFRTNDNQKALRYALDAKKTFMELHSWRELIETYILLGIIYTDIKEYTNAEEVLNKGLKLSSEGNNNFSASKALHNLGLVYLNTGKYERSLQFFNRGLELKMKCDPNNLFLSYIGILLVHLRNDNFDEFNVYMKVAAKYCKNDYQLHQLKVLEGKMEYRLENYDLYVQIMENSLKYLHKNKIWYEIVDNAKQLSQYHYSQRRYKKAYYYLELELEATTKLYREMSI
ncbi:tetratricopeptide repeat protein [Evansella sp. AB-rgal1]|uniref:tetratricopeptide repeat protein n=1 Tax=Evansella sp. AB-rgal1 TaxID=3242696 RepID=UPI00359EE0B5